MTQFILDESLLDDSQATLDPEAPYLPVLVPGDGTIPGSLVAPSQGSIFPSDVLYPGSHVYDDATIMVGRPDRRRFWNTPIDWLRANLSSALVYYEQFVAPLHHLRGGHTQSLGSYNSTYTETPATGTINWNSALETLEVFNGSYWVEVVTRTAAFNVIYLDTTQLDGPEVLGYPTSEAADGFTLDMSTLGGPHYLN